MYPTLVGGKSCALMFSSLLNLGGVWEKVYPWLSSIFYIYTPDPFSTWASEGSIGSKGGKESMLEGNEKIKGEETVIN